MIAVTVTLPSGEAPAVTAGTAVVVSATGEVPPEPPQGAQVIISQTGPPGQVGPQGPIDTGALDALAEHILAAEPHPAYDDLPSFALRWSNVIV